MASLRQDVKFGLRMLAKSPSLSLIAILSLALAIGANTAIFTVWNAIMWQAVPVQDPARVVNLYTVDSGGSGIGGGNYLALSFPNYQDYAKDQHVFSGLVAYQDMPATLNYQNRAEQVTVELATGNYFQVLGLHAARGRVFTAAETASDGKGALAVLSYPFWNQRFGGDPAIVGRTISLNGEAFMVAGVAPADFRGTLRLLAPDLWAPMSMHAQLLTGQNGGYFYQRRPRIFNAFGRLAPGVSVAAAQAAVAVTAHALEQQFPADNAGQAAVVIPLPQSALSPNLRANFQLALWMMMAVVGLVLLIACANVANLLLARGLSRHREIAVRLAMGATRRQLVRQLLVESVLLALIAGGLGILFASWARDLLWAHRPAALANTALNLSLDPDVLLFALGLSLLTGVLFGLAPALHATRMDLITQLKERSQPALSGQRPWSLRGLLLIGEVAFSLVALIVAGLFLASLHRTETTDPGFAAAHLASLQYDLGAAGLDLAKPGAAQQVEQLNRQLLAKARALPGVVNAAIASGTPMNAANFARSYLIAGQPLPPGRAKQFISVEAVSPAAYFATMGVPLLEGRDFSDNDTAAGQKVVILNQTGAKRLFPGRDALGQRLQFTGDRDFTVVVGVARDSKYFTLSEDPTPFAYLPLAQWPQTAFGLVVRTAGPPAAALPALRAAVHAWMPNLAATQVEAAEVPIRNSLWQAEMGASLLGALAMLALLLAAIGIYGVMAYGVRQRARELGIRMALGASSKNVFGHVLSGGMTLVAIGLGLGVVGALLLGRLVSTLLFGIQAADPQTFAGYSLLFLAVALAASFIPARRATRIHPAITLRND